MCRTKGWTSLEICLSYDYYFYLLSTMHLGYTLKTPINYIFYNNLRVQGSWKEATHCKALVFSSPQLIIDPV